MKKLFQIIGLTTKFTAKCLFWGALCYLLLVLWTNNGITPLRSGSTLLVLFVTELLMLLLLIIIIIISGWGLYSTEGKLLIRELENVPRSKTSILHIMKVLFASFATAVGAQIIMIGTLILLNKTEWFMLLFFDQMMVFWFFLVCAAFPFMYMHLK